MRVARSMPLVLALGILVAACARLGSRTDEKAGLALTMPLPGGMPIPLGVRTTLRSAIQREPYELFRPQDPMASDASIARVWTSPNKAAIQYRSGVLLIVGPSQLAHPWQQYEASHRGAAFSSEVIHIGEAPALAGPLEGGKPFVDLVIRGVQVQLQCGTSGLGIADMLRIAGSIHQGTAG